MDQHARRLAAGSVHRRAVRRHRARRRPVHAGAARSAAGRAPSTPSRPPDIVEIGTIVGAHLLRDEITAGRLEPLVRDALDFPVPLVQVTDRVWALELFHGPTLAFKDVGARVQARLLHHFTDGTPLTILVATSGDTGSAVAQAFHRVPDTRVVVLYPEGQVSDVQEAQMASLGDNITAVAVRRHVRRLPAAGQAGVCRRRAAHARVADAGQLDQSRPAAAAGLLLLPARWRGGGPRTGRVRAERQLRQPDGRPDRQAASACRSRSFVAATNVNDAVPAISASRASTSRGHRSRTVANAMDVGAPSNFERDAVRSTTATSTALRATSSGVAYDDAQVVAEIGRRLSASTATCSIRTAPSRWLGAAGRAACRTPEAVGVFLATAHPAKFREVVEPAIGAAGRRCRRALADAIAVRDTHLDAAVRRTTRTLRAPLGCESESSQVPATRDPYPIQSPGDPPTPRRDPRAATAGTCSRICTSWDEWTARYRELEAADRGVQARSRARWRRGRTACWPRSARWTRWAPSAIASGITRRCSTTRISATTRSTRRRQQVQILFARQQQAELLVQPGTAGHPARDHPRLDGRRTPSSPSTASPSRACSTSRSTCSTSRASGCCRIAGRFNSVPHDSYAALTTADMKFPTITLASGEQVTLTYGQYRALLETNRSQEDRAAAYRAFHQAYADNQNTYAALYNGVLQRDWFHARARGYATTLDAALHGNNIPTVGRREPDRGRRRHGVEPLRRYHRLRRRVLGARHVPPVRRLRAARASTTRGIPTTRSGTWIVDSVAPLGARVPAAGAARVRRALDRRVRERGQAQRRVLGAGVRGASVHAAQLQRDARRRVHAGARDGPLDAHAAVASGAAVRLRRATRSSSPRCRRR